MPGRNLFDRTFRPVAQLGDCVLLLGAQDFYSDANGMSLFEVTAIEALPLLGTHGAITIWTQAGGVVATFPYLLDSGAAAGTINSGGGSVTTQTLNSLKNGVDEVTQLRFLSKAYGSLPGSWLQDDYDIQISQPGSTRRWTLANANGVMNQMGQAPLAADAGVLPAQGATAGLPSAYPSVSPFELAYRTELFVYKDNAPTATIINTGSANMSTAMGVALMVAGFKYKVRAFNSDAVRVVEMLGSDIKVPQWLSMDELRWKVPILPVAGRG